MVVAREGADVGVGQAERKLRKWLDGLGTEEGLSAGEHSHAQLRTRPPPSESPFSVSSLFSSSSLAFISSLPGNGAKYYTGLHYALHRHGPRRPLCILDGDRPRPALFAYSPHLPPFFQWL